MSKIGLVVEGGGMKCAYSAGILDRFLDDHITFDYCIGVSAGSANTASFLAGQKERNLRFYTIYVKDPKYLSLRNYLFHGQLFGLEYIYGSITNSDGIDPIDFPAILANPCEYEMVATNRATGKAAYFNKSSLKQDDYRAIMASSALPVFCRPVELDGEYYYDGGISDAIPVNRAFESGCDKIVVITSKPRGYVKQPESGRALYSHILRKYPEMINAIDNRHVMYRQNIADMKRYEEEGRAFIIAPSNPPRMSTFSKDPVLEQQLYDLGLSDYEVLRDQLEKFLI